MENAQRCVHFSLNVCCPQAGVWRARSGQQGAAVVSFCELWLTAGQGPRWCDLVQVMHGWRPATCVTQPARECISIHHAACTHGRPCIALQRSLCDVFVLPCAVCVNPSQACACRGAEVEGGAGQRTQPAALPGTVQVKGPVVVGMRPPEGWVQNLGELGQRMVGGPADASSRIHPTHTFHPGHTYEPEARPRVVCMGSACNDVQAGVAVCKK